MTSSSTRSLRVDARRNRERIMASAGGLFARLGHEAHMAQIAADSRLGTGTLYRHFPTKQALLTAILQRRLQGMSDLARAAEQISDPLEAFETILLSYLEAADRDAGFQQAIVGVSDVEWGDVEQHMAEFAAILTRIIGRAVDSAQVRRDFTWPDFIAITGGIISTMYLKPAGNTNWRRHLEIVIDGVRITAFQ